MIDLKFTVSEFGKITRTDLTPVISDSIGWYSATFTFHASWSEAKTALFKNGTVEAEAVLVNNTCVIPSTVLAERGDIRVSVYCGARKTANVSKVQLTPSGYFEATPPAPPEPTQVAMYTFSDASGVRMFRYLDSKLEWYNGTVWTEVTSGTTVTIINDLTTGGTTSALSAEQGKTLQTSKLAKDFTGETAETIIVDTDQFPMNKTNGTIKKTAWTLIKSTLKTAHDLLYIPKLFDGLDSLTSSELSGSAILPVNKSGLLNKISFNTLSSYLMEYSTHVSLTTVAQTIKGAINELFTSVGNKIAKTTNITSIDDTGIADGEIMVANLTGKKIETSNVLIGDVRLKNNLIAEYTVDVAYPSGAPVADAGTDTITLVGHGFLDNQCIEITAGTGAIPGGLTAINSSKFTQVHGKFYGYVMNKTNDTFQVYSTLGTVTAIDITSAGTAGWLVRLAGLTTVNFTGLSLANIGDSYSVSIVGTMIASTTGSLYVTSILNGYGASLVYFMPHTDQSFWGAALLYLSTPIVSASKYTSMSMKVDYIKVGTEEIAINSGWGGIRTNDFATNTLVSMANLTGFARYSSFTTVTTIRIQTTCLMLNGTKLLLAKEN